MDKQPDKHIQSLQLNLILYFFPHQALKRLSALIKEALWWFIRPWQMQDFFKYVVEGLSLDLIVRSYDCQNYSVTSPKSGPTQKKL